MSMHLKTWQWVVLILGALLLFWFLFVVVY